MKFVGRERELKYLHDMYKKKNSQLIIIYGRRRLGKTSLIKESIKNETNSNYFLLVQESIEKNLDYFKEELSVKLNNPILKDVNASSWVEYFRLIKDFIPQNFILILDELPYLIQQDRGIVSQFQKIYDEYLKPKNVKLILCGSSISVMGDLMSYQSPLYGRRTGVINLKELSFYEVKKLLSKIEDLEVIMKYYMIFGGIPYYLEQLDQNLSFEKNLHKLFFNGQSMFLDEINFLLKEEFREVRNYLSIFKSIAKGKNKFSEIAQDSYIEKSSLSKYLINLEILGLIRNVKSFFDKPNSKKTIYVIEDNYIFFWFAAISDNLSNLENKKVQANILKLTLPRVFGYLFEKVSMRILSKQFEKIGTYFRNDIEIDILGQIGDKVTCFECKFKSDINEKEILNKLEEKISLLPNEFKYDKKIISINNEINLQKLLEISKYHNSQF